MGSSPTPGTESTMFDDLLLIQCREAGILFFDVLRESKAIHSPPPPGIIHDAMFLIICRKKMPFACAAILLLDVRDSWCSANIAHSCCCAMLRSQHIMLELHDCGCFLSRRIKRRGSGGVAHGGHWNCDGRC